MPALAQGPDTGRVVCGEKIHLQGAFGEVKIDPNAPGTTSAALQKALNERASSWPTEVRNKVTGAYSAMVDADFAPSDYRVDDLGVSLQPKQVAFANTRFQLDLPKSNGDPLCGNSSEKDARKEAAEFVITFTGVFGQLTAPQFRLVAKRIETLEAVYDKYLFEGFPMFPWEAAVNSWFLAKERIAEGPPRDAIVVLHPAAGIVSSVDSDSKSDTGSVLSIEPLGWIRYSADYETWYGISLLAVFPADREAGYGVALNYRNFKLGVTYHDDDTGEYDGAAIFLGMDLYQLLGEKQRSYKAYFERVKQELNP
jgi:hypothetical protein